MMSNIYFSGGLLEIAYPSDRCLPEAAAGQGVRFRPEADISPVSLSAPHPQYTKATAQTIVSILPAWSATTLDQARSA